MSPSDFERLRPYLEFSSFERGHVLVDAGAPMGRVYFLEGGVGSIVAVSPEGLEVEAGLFGRDGVTPTPLLMGASTAPHRILIQVTDDAWSLPAEPFMAAVDESPALRGLMLRYVQTLTVQIAYTALSNAVHQIDERLARWILMCDDRCGGGEMALTHEFMSIMLAVRRPSVTSALHILEGNGFIRAERGRILVRDRRGMEEFAGDAYGKPEAVYRETIGALS